MVSLYYRHDAIRGQNDAGMMVTCLSKLNMTERDNLLIQRPGILGKGQGGGDQLQGGRVIDVILEYPASLLGKHESDDGLSPIPAGDTRVIRRPRKSKACQHALE